MKLNGHHLQKIIKRALFESETAYKEFTKNRLQFQSQPNKATLDELHAKFVAVNNRLARFKTVQDFYNVAVTVDVDGEKMSLSEALNRQDLAGKEAKLWRLAAEADVQVPAYSRLGDIEKVRDKDKEYAVRAMPRENCLKRSAEAEDRAYALRQAVATGNLTTLDTLPNGKFLTDYLNETR